MNSCEARDCSQVSIEKAVKQLLNIFEHYSGSYDPDAILSADDAISTSLNYRELTGKLYSVFEGLFTDSMDRLHGDEGIQSTIAKIEEYMITHISLPVTLQLLSDKFGYSPSYICNLFRTIKGVPPVKYLNAIRINKAKELISQQPDFLLREIAAIVGYDDPLYFSRIFKKETGFGPKEYRKMTFD